jgi:hypothetical protein
LELLRANDGLRSRETKLTSRVLYLQAGLNDRSSHSGLLMNFSSGQGILIKTFHNEANTPVITNVALKVKVRTFCKAHKICKKSSSWFGRLLSKYTKHQEDCANFCVLPRKSFSVNQKITVWQHV